MALIYYSDGTALIGITDYAQEMLTIRPVHCRHRPECSACHGGCCRIGEVRIRYIFPVTGEVIEVNQALEDTPELINQDAFGEGWIVSLRLSDPEELKMLLTAADYEEMIKEEK